MRTKYSIILILVFALLFAGCSEDNTSVKTLFITGDLKSIVTLSSYDGETTVDKLIQDSDGTPKEIFFIAHDGFTAKVSAADASNCTLLYDAENGWYIDAPNFPPSTSAKDLAMIVVLADDSQTGILIDNERLSLGEILTSPLTYFPISEGTSETETHKSEVFTREKGFMPEKLDGKSLVLYTSNGEKFLIGESGYFVVNTEQIDFREANGEYYEDIEKVETRE